MSKDIQKQKIVTKPAMNVSRYLTQACVDEVYLGTGSLLQFIQYKRKQCVFNLKRNYSKFKVEKNLSILSTKKYLMFQSD